MLVQNLIANAEKLSRTKSTRKVKKERKKELSSLKIIVSEGRFDGFLIMPVFLMQTTYIMACIVRDYIKIHTFRMKVFRDIICLKE